MKHVDSKKIKVDTTYKVGGHIISNRWTNLKETVVKNRLNKVDKILHSILLSGGQTHLTVDILTNNVDNL